MNCIGVGMWTAIFGGLLILRIFHPWLGSLDQELAPRLVARARHVSGAGGAASWSSWSALPLLVYLLNLVDIDILDAFSPRYNEDSWILDCILQSSWLWILWWLPLFATINEPGWSIGSHRGWLQDWWTVPWASAGRPSNSRLGFSRMAGKFIVDFLDDYDFIWFYKVMIHDGHDVYVWRACLAWRAPWLSMTCLKGSRVSSDGSSMTCLLPSSLSWLPKVGRGAIRAALELWLGLRSQEGWLGVLSSDWEEPEHIEAKTTEIYNLPPNQQES